MTRLVIRSMTGFGQATAESPGARVTVELRSVNHRFADLRLRLPPEFACCEPEVRKRILARVQRGHIDAVVSMSRPDGREGMPQLDHALLDHVLAASELLSSKFQLEGRVDVRTVLAIPGMFKIGPAEVADESGWRAALDRALEAALSALEGERSREGCHLSEELLARLVTMRELTARLGARAVALPPLVRERLVQRLRSLAPDVELDPARMAQEAAILADRSDVTEELVRLDGHMRQTESLLSEPDGLPVGKRLEFLLQEIHRETNTINAKSADLAISQCALALKVELEKVREQSQNLE